MTLKRILISVAILVLLAPVVLAQDATPDPPNFIDALSPIIGIGIGVLVSLLKRVTWVANNPKTTAAILSALVPVIMYAVSGGLGGEAGTVILKLVLQVFTQLAAAIGTYEIAIKPVSEAGDRLKEN